MDIVLLGRPSIRFGPEQPKLAGRQQALLARLALDAPRTVSAEALIDTIWSVDLPSDPANALQQRISSLRKAVDPEGTGQVVATSEHGYALKVHPDQVDIHRFAKLAQLGNELLASSDLEAAVATLEDAIALWQGEPFEGFGHELWAIADAQRLYEIYLRVREDRFETQLGLGAGADLVADLTEFVASNPLRERACGQLLRALYRSGRQGDALAFYDQTRELLLEELGIDPGPELQRIYEQVLDQDAGLVADSAPQGRRRLRPGGNIPAPTTDVIGRDGATEQVSDLLANGRLVTLTGPGGAGKTTLSLATARRLTPPDGGSWFIELAPITDGDTVVETVAQTLGLGGSGLGRETLDLIGLSQAIADLELLLIFDNCEHVIQDVASTVESLLAAAPGLKVLATSREPLGVGGELLWSVPALALPETEEQNPEKIAAAPAVMLLLERIRSHNPDFTFNPDDAAAAATVVRQLDGIPLAIELAAARTRAMSLQEVAAGLIDRFDLLTNRSRTAPSRQRTLRATLEWSWDLLTDEERLAWAALSVPMDRFTRDFAARLLDSVELHGPPTDHLANLIDRSLLNTDTTSGTTRYRMLETIRAYGIERLADFDLDTTVRTAHADAIADQLARCHQRTDEAEYGVDLDGLGSLIGDARAALAWTETAKDHQRMQVIAGHLGWFWLLSGLGSEGKDWINRSFESENGDPPTGLNPGTVDGQALLWASALRSAGTDPNSRAWATLSLQAGLLPQERILAEVFAAVHLAHDGEMSAAVTALETVVEHSTPIGGWPLGFAHIITAQIGRLSGRRDVLRKHAEPGLKLVTEAGVTWCQAQAIEIVTDDLAAGGHHQRALELATEGLDLSRAQNVPELEALMLRRLASAVHELGDPERAADLAEEAVELGRIGGARPTLGYILTTAGGLARQRGELDNARDLLEEATLLFAGSGTWYGSTSTMIEQARLATADSDPGAVGFTIKALEMAVEVGDPTLITQGLTAFAEAATAVGQTDVAHRALFTAEDLPVDDRVVQNDLTQRIQELASALD